MGPLKHMGHAASPSHPVGSLPELPAVPGAGSLDSTCPPPALPLLSEKRQLPHFSSELSVFYVSPRLCHFREVYCPYAVWCEWTKGTAHPWESDLLCIFLWAQVINLTCAGGVELPRHVQPTWDGDIQGVQPALPRTCAVAQSWAGCTWQSKHSTQQFGILGYLTERMPGVWRWQVCQKSVPF